MVTHMSEKISSSKEPLLTAAQAADVIRYYHAGDNERARANGWKDKISVGRSALRATGTVDTILPDGQAPLTKKEMYMGLNHILNPPKSDAYYDKLEKLAEKRNIPYDEARAILDNNGEK